MSSGKRGGYSKVVYSTTSNFASSTEITNLLSGTTPGTGTHDTEQDSAGNNFSTGYRHTGEIHTSSVTAAFITNLIAAQIACTKLYFRFYGKGSSRIVIGSSIVTLSYQGAEAGQIQRYVISHEAYEEDAADVVTIEA